MNLSELGMFKFSLIYSNTVDSKKKVYERIVFYFEIIQPTGTQRPINAHLCSYFDRDIPDHNRTKIGCIKSLTYFGFAMSGMDLES